MDESTYNFLCGELPTSWRWAELIFGPPQIGSFTVFIFKVAGDWIQHLAIKMYSLLLGFFDFGATPWLETSPNPIAVLPRCSVCGILWGLAGIDGGTPRDLQDQGSRFVVVACIH